MSYAIPDDEPGSAGPAALSVLVHLVLFAFLYLGVRWQSRQPDTVMVELWNQLPEVQEPAPKAEPKPEAKPLLKLEPRLEPKRTNPDIAIERERKTKKKEEPKKEPSLKFDAARRMQEQIAQEQQALNRERQEARKKSAPAPAASAIDSGYADKIRSKIKSNIVLPPDIKGNPEAIFDVVQLPTGDVIDVNLRKSSGYKPYDDAVDRAIRKSSPLPQPDRPEQFRRELQLKFRPQE
jgi:colicin import membrane protein